MNKIREAQQMADQKDSYLELFISNGTEHIYLSGRKNIETVLNSREHLLKELIKILDEKFPRKQSIRNSSYNGEDS
jgi:hypothetical protein